MSIRQRGESGHEFPQTGLFAALGKKEASKELSFLLDSIFRQVEKILNNVAKIFPDFTPHDISHARTVITNLDRLVPSDVIRQMKAEHIFVLLGAALMHDVGMAPVRDIREILASLGMEQALTNEEREAIRKTHHLRSYEWITTSTELDRVGFKRGNLREAVALVARDHRQIDIRSDRELSDLAYRIGVEKLDFLAAVLRLADEMDISADRIADTELRPDVICRMTGEQRQAFVQSTLVGEWSLSYHGEMLMLEANVAEIRSGSKTAITSGELLSILNTVVQKLRKTLSEIRYVTWLNDRYVLPIQLQLRTRVTDPAYGNSVNEQVGTRVDESAVIHYLIESLHPNFLDVVRELVANGIDACSPLRGTTGYVPFVKVELCPAEPRVIPTLGLSETNPPFCLVVTDNGIGMTRGVLENHFLVLGSSYFGADYLKQLASRGISARAHPIIGKFGIGAFSALGITDQVLVETIPIDRASSERVGYTAVLSRHLSPVFEDNQLQDRLRVAHGTRITLPLTRTGILGSGVLSQLRRVFKRPRIAILAKMPGQFGRSFDIPAADEAPQCQEEMMKEGVMVLRTSRTSDLHTAFAFSFDADALFYMLLWNAIAGSPDTQAQLEGWGSPLSNPSVYPRVTRVLEEGRKLLDFDVGRMVAKQHTKEFMLLVLEREARELGVPRKATPTHMLSEKPSYFWDGIFWRTGESELLREGILVESVLDFQNRPWLAWAWPFDWLLGSISPRDTWIDFGSAVADIDLNRSEIILSELAFEQLRESFWACCLEALSYLFTHRFDSAVLEQVQVVARALVLRRLGPVVGNRDTREKWEAEFHRYHGNVEHPETFRNLVELADRLPVFLHYG